MATIDAARLAEIKARLKATPPLPWQEEYAGVCSYAKGITAGDGAVVLSTACTDCAGEDGHMPESARVLLLNSRQDMADLISGLEERDRIISDLIEGIQEMGTNLSATAASTASAEDIPVFGSMMKKLGTVLTLVIVRGGMTIMKAKIAEGENPTRTQQGQKQDATA